MSTLAVFISYAHRDKRVARRLQRSLWVHGIDAWLDERGLRPGASLARELQARIAASDALVVVASAASIQSTWVGLELACAREHGKPVVPFLVEPVQTHERFQGDLGIEVLHPNAVAQATRTLIAALGDLGERSTPLSPDPERLREALRQMAAQEADLRPLIEGCMDGPGLHQESMPTVFAATFEALDEALDALYDLEPGERMAMHLAHAFASTGAGWAGLQRWIARSGDGETALAVALGRELRADAIDPAIDLLGRCNPPNNQALYGFIDRHAAQFSSAQKAAVLRLVAWPVRKDPGRMGDVLAWVAARHFPGAREVELMWTRWIGEGAFDGGAASPRDLARYLRDADREQLPGWAPMKEALRAHVRRSLRSGDQARVHVAIDHLRASADSGAPVLDDLLGEAEGAAYTAEWNQWRLKDPDSAEFMADFLREVIEEARADRDWLGAATRARRLQDLRQKQRDAALLANSPPAGDDR